VASSESTLETARLVLRRYSEHDRLKFIELNTDPIVREKMDGALDENRAAQVFDRVKNETYSLAITDKNSKKYLGHIYLSESDTEIEGEIGFLFFPKYWGNGYATEAAKGLIEYLIVKSKYRQLIATIDVDHHPSIRVLEKLGFTMVSEEADDEGIFLLYKLSLKSGTK
jgi:RimJ/RimL family protein N-acetyltransferase